jgi:hypothetical protein
MSLTLNKKEGDLKHQSATTAGNPCTDRSRTNTPTDTGPYRVGLDLPDSIRGLSYHPVEWWRKGRRAATSSLSVAGGRRTLWRQ